MKKEIPFFAISNDEIEKLKPIGKMAKCPNCNKQHKIKFGHKILPNGEKELYTGMGFVNCGKKSFLVSINGKKL